MIAIVDFGGQLTLLIARRLRELKIKPVLLNPEDVQKTAPVGVCGVILSGGPNSVTAADTRVAKKILAWHLPVLGICFGHQLLAKTMGGKVATNKLTQREYGQALCKIVKRQFITRGLTTVSTVWMSHGDSVSAVPTGWQVLGETETGTNAIMACSERPLFGVQFHPEARHTAEGEKLLSNFAKLCKAPRTFTTADLTSSLVSQIQEHVGESDHIFVACSLGVDSTTVAMLCQKALGHQRVHPVFIDNGLLRQEDLNLAKRASEFLPRFKKVRAQGSLFADLIGVANPDKKRRIIGTHFWNQFTATAKVLGRRFPIHRFTQGTIAPDVIESAESSGQAALIKPHHNLVKRPGSFPFEPLEPLRSHWLFKDEVRVVAGEAGVPGEIIYKHPFPGPGLAVRATGPMTQQRLKVARACDAIWNEELHRAGHYFNVSQAMVHLSNERTTCVQGDKRHRGWSFQLYAWSTADFMTAEPADLPPDFIRQAVQRVTREVPQVGRGGYNYTDKPQATMEPE